MKPSEMTNEELAKALMLRVPLDSNNHDDIREASARLRRIDLTIVAQKAKAAAEGYADGCKVADLRRRLKVAEEALDKVYKCIDNRYGVDASLLAKKIIADALAAIREEGGMK